MRKIPYFVILFCLANPAWAGSPLKKCEAHDEILSSRSVAKGAVRPKEVPYRVFLPKGYDPARKYGVVYFLHGRGENHRMLDRLNFCSALDSEIDKGAGAFIVVAPSGEDNYWMNGAKTGERWGDLVTRELVSQIETRYPVIASPKGRLISGISMGGHGAFQLSLNYPGIFGAVAGHSAVFRTEEEAQKDFPAQFGTGEQFADRDPVSLIRKKGKKLDVPVWLDMGGADPFLKNTRGFGKILESLKTNAALSIGNDPNGGHDSRYWSARLPEYIRWYARNLSMPPSPGTTNPDCRNEAPLVTLPVEGSLLWGE